MNTSKVDFVDLLGSAKDFGYRSLSKHPVEATFVGLTFDSL